MSTRCSTCSPPASDSRNLNLPASGTVAVRMLPRALVPAWGRPQTPPPDLPGGSVGRGRASANDREQPRSRSSRFRHGHGPHAPAGKPPGAGRLRLRSASDPRSEPVPPWSGNSRDFHRGLRPPPRLTSVAGHSVPEISGNSSLRDNQALAPTPKARNAAYPTDQAPLCPYFRSREHHSNLWDPRSLHTSPLLFRPNNSGDVCKDLDPPLAHPRAGVMSFMRKRPHW